MEMLKGVGVKAERKECMEKVVKTSTKYLLFTTYQLGD